MFRYLGPSSFLGLLIKEDNKGDPLTVVHFLKRYRERTSRVQAQVVGIEDKDQTNGDHGQRKRTLYPEFELNQVLPVRYRKVELVFVRSDIIGALHYVYGYQEPRGRKGGE